METSTITFYLLPHVISGISEKIDRVLELLEKEVHARSSSSHDTSTRYIRTAISCSTAWIMTANYTSFMKNTAEQCSFSVTENAEQICDTVNEFKEELNQKMDDIKANPPVQKVETTHHIARESWQWYLTLGFSIFSTLLFFAMIFWQEGRIEQYRISDIKYHYILMNGGVGTIGLDSIESRFNDTKKVKQIEAEVRAYEERVQEQSRKRAQIQSLLKDLESAAD